MKQEAIDMKSHYKTGILAACLLLAAPGWADVSGKVSHKNRPLEGCEVLHGSSAGTTASDGGFTLPLAATVTESLEIHCEGFAPKYVALQAGESDLGKIRLKRPNFILIVSDDHGWVQTSTQMDPDDPETKAIISAPRTSTLFLHPGSSSREVIRPALIACRPGVHSRHRNPRCGMHLTALPWTNGLKTIKSW